MSVAYLVNHGTAAFVSRCTAPPGGVFARGDRVVLRGRRGVEAGVVLCEVPGDAPADGELLRGLTEDDESALSRVEGIGRRLFDDAARLAGELGLPIAVLDVEVLLDGGQAVLHAVHWAECDASPLFERLSENHGLRVTLLDLTHRPAPEHGGCGKPGCGNGGCDSCGSGGCSSGGCSSGKVKSADEMTAYFAGLRRQMEQQQARVPLA
jgi:hypothetical protein